MAASTRRALLSAAPAAALAGSSFAVFAGAPLLRAAEPSPWHAAVSDYRAAAGAVDAAGDRLLAVEAAVEAARQPHPADLTHSWRRHPHPEVYSEPLHGKHDIDRAFPEKLSHVPTIAQQRAKALAALPIWIASEKALQAAVGLPEAEAASEAAYERERVAFARLLAIVPPSPSAWVETLQIIVARSPEDVDEHVTTLVAAARNAGVH